MARRLQRLAAMTLPAAIGGRIVGHAQTRDAIGARGELGDATATGGAVAVTTWPGAVLLIDLESMVGHKAGAAVLSARLEALIRCAGPGVAVVAASAPSALTPDGARILRGQRVTLLDAGDSKAGAEHALLAEAQRLASAGCRRFVAASDDTRLKQLAELGELEIILWQQQKPDPTYLTSARRVHRLAIPPVSRGRKAVPPVSLLSGSAPGRAGQTSHGAGSQGLAAVVSQAPGRGPQPTAPDHAAGSGLAVRFGRVGAAWLGAGILFGAGIAIGDVTVRRLLGRVGWSPSR